MTFNPFLIAPARTFLSVLFISILITACSVDEQNPETDVLLTAEGNIVLSVKGLHCEACVVSATNVLEKINGIAEVQVSLEEETAIIRPVSDSIPDFPEIQEALRKIGYEVELIEL
ncbi:MAG: heavy metal-associated domain-containing protein [Balneolales bacterium]